MSTTFLARSDVPACYAISFSALPSVESTVPALSIRAIVRPQKQKIISRWDELPLDGLE